MSTITKAFDAVAFQRKTREEIDLQTKGMSFEERKLQTKRSVAKLKGRIQNLKSRRDS